MKMKYLLVLSALMTLVSSPVFAHTGVNADHSKVKNLLLHREKITQVKKKIVMRKLHR